MIHQNTPIELQQLVRGEALLASQLLLGAAVPDDMKIHPTHPPHVSARHMHTKGQSPVIRCMIACAVECLHPRSSVRLRHLGDSQSCSDHKPLWKGSACSITIYAQHKVVAFLGAHYRRMCTHNRNPRLNCVEIGERRWRKSVREEANVRRGGRR